MIRDHTWHYPWPDMIIVKSADDVTCADLETSLYAFGHSKDIVRPVNEQSGRVYRLRPANIKGIPSFKLSYRKNWKFKDWLRLRWQPTTTRNGHKNSTMILLKCILKILKLHFHLTQGSLDSSKYYSLCTSYLCQWMFFKSVVLIQNNYKLERKMSKYNIKESTAKEQWNTLGAY